MRKCMLLVALGLAGQACVVSGETNEDSIKFGTPGGNEVEFGVGSTTSDCNEIVDFQGQCEAIEETVHECFDDKSTGAVVANCQAVSGNLTVAECQSVTSGGLKYYSCGNR